MTNNPWKVDSLQAFSCLKCPECPFFTKEENTFANHAIVNHPLSKILFDYNVKKVLKPMLEESKNNAVVNFEIGAKYLGVFSSRSLKMREKCIGFDQFFNF